jgi:hypothetical protein
MISKGAQSDDYAPRGMLRIAEHGKTLQEESINKPWWQQSPGTG